MKSLPAPQPFRYGPRGRIGSRALVVVGSLVVLAALIQATTRLEDLRSPMVTFTTVLLGAVLVTALPQAVSRGVAGALVVLGCGLAAAFILLGVAEDAEIMVLIFVVMLVAGGFTLPPRAREPFTAIVGLFHLVTLVSQGIDDPAVLLVHLAGIVIVAVLCWSASDLLEQRLARADASRQEAESQAELLASLVRIDTLEPGQVLQAVGDGLQAIGLSQAGIYTPAGEATLARAAGFPLAEIQASDVSIADPLIQAVMAAAPHPVQLPGDDPRMGPYHLDVDEAVALAVADDLGDPLVVLVAGTRHGPVSTLQREAAALLVDQAAHAMRRVREYETDGRTVQQLRDLEQRVNEFVSTASHELRTPVTVIDGLSATLSSRWDDLPAARRDDLLDRIGRNAERLETIVHSLLRTAALEGGRLTPTVAEVALGELCDAVLSRLASVMEGHPVSCELGDAVVAGDAALLEHVFENLLSNVAKYTPVGTPVRITASQTPDGEVEVQVVDEGPGIDPEDLPLVFDRFYRGGDARHVGGLGLGLALTRQIIEVHGGRMEVGSSPGAGTTFRFWLPCPQ